MDIPNIQEFSLEENKCNGIIAIPITFFDKYCLEQFEIINGMNRYMILDEESLNQKIRVTHSHLCNINNKATYFRILIRRKEEKHDS